MNKKLFHFWIHGMSTSRPHLFFSLLKQIDDVIKFGTSRLLILHASSSLNLMLHAAAVGVRVGCRIVGDRETETVSLWRLVYLVLFSPKI